MFKDSIVENIKNSTMSFSPHLHSSYVVSITHKGLFKSEYKKTYYNNYRYTTRVLHPFELHAGSSIEWDYTCFYPSRELMSEIYFQIYHKKVEPCFADHIIKDKRLYFLLAEFFKALYQNEDEMQIETALYEALSYLIVHFCSNAKDKNFETVKMDKSLTITYICDMMPYKITLDDLASNASLSKFHFLRLFKKSFGVTPHKFILYKRIEKAKQSILNGKNISQASIEAGFSDQSHFTKQFKKLYGYTPKFLESSDILLYR